jgi:hypothetical protein
MWYASFLSDFDKLELARQIFEKPSNIKFNQNPFSGRLVVPFGQTDMMQLTAASRNLAHAPAILTVTAMH